MLPLTTEVIILVCLCSVQAVYKLEGPAETRFWDGENYSSDSKTDVWIESTPLSIIMHIFFKNGSQGENDGHIQYSTRAVDCKCNRNTQHCCFQRDSHGCSEDVRELPFSALVYNKCHLNALAKIT